MTTAIALFHRERITFNGVDYFRDVWPGQERVSDITLRDGDVVLDLDEKTKTFKVIGSLDKTRAAATKKSVRNPRTRK